MQTGTAAAGAREVDPGGCWLHGSGQVRRCGASPGSASFSPRPAADGITGKLTKAPYGILGRSCHCRYLDVARTSGDISHQLRRVVALAHDDAARPGASIGEGRDRRLWPDRRKARLLSLTPAHMRLIRADTGLPRACRGWLKDRSGRVATDDWRDAVSRPRIGFRLVVVATPSQFARAGDTRASPSKRASTYLVEKPGATPTSTSCGPLVERSLLRAIASGCASDLNRYRHHRAFRKARALAEASGALATTHVCARALTAMADGIG